MKNRKEQKADSYYVASQWRLMWLKLKKHKLAIFSAVVLTCLYFVAIFCEMISPILARVFCQLSKLGRYSRRGRNKAARLVGGIARSGT